ncbi:hypothetical protein BKD09_43040 [Bradyrhizobium japonicum]|uniref:Carboxypeptidase regulatory-like domain-containing protein n=1 Tax=Bradyrhizobium japonicum TaxID=375 RepID=A0A1L3FP67_BRAJP|nr:hypothetical protein BKD09_43040 [Bradyrhizobium japonicum]
MVAGRLGLTASVPRNRCFIHVTLRDGQPLAGARIAVEQASGPVPELMYQTDADGHAQIGLPTGEVRLRIFTASGESRSVDINVGAEPDKTYDVTIDPP